MRLPATTAALVLTSVVALSAAGLANADQTAAVNHAPVAVDDTATVVASATVDIDVLANDLDPDGATLSVDAVGTPSAGSVDVVGTVVRYTAPSVPGLVTFTYTVSDGYRTADATVTVTVTTSTNTPPTAQDDDASTTRETPVRIDVTANDSDPDGDSLVVSVLSGPSNGSAAVDANEVVYTPTPGFVGNDQLTYQVDDGRGGRAQAIVRIEVTLPRIVRLQVAHRIVALAPGVVTVSINKAAGEPSLVAVQRQIGGTWHTMGKGHPGADLTWAMTWRPNRPGRLKLRAFATWADGPDVFSQTAVTRVVARFDVAVTQVQRRDVPYTWHPGCPVGPKSLRMITMNYWDYHGRIQRGRLVGAAWAVRAYVHVFRVALRTHFPIKHMYPADRYHGVDVRAMAAGDTSAFNCRHVTGNPYRISQHSWGDAIDINTFENPYVTSSRVYPAAAARPYYWRRAEHLHDPGVITRRSSIARALWRQGWAWGARWSPPDYQHWSRNGG
jgi:hypothetical protein